MTTRTKWFIAACVTIAVLATGSTAYYFKQRGADPSKMSAEQIQTYMQSQDFNSMPREQRREFFEKVMDARVEGYFNTPPQEREKYLDKIIDDMQKFRPRNFDPQRVRDPNHDSNRMQQAQQRRNATPQQRRLRREMQDPVKNAMRHEFGMALGARAAQRGIQMGGFGGGRGPRQ